MARTPGVELDVQACVVAVPLLPHCPTPHLHRQAPAQPRRRGFYAGHNNTIEDLLLADPSVNPWIVELCKPRLKGPAGISASGTSKATYGPVKTKESTFLSQR